MGKLEDAEAALLALEQYRHAIEIARGDMRQAEFTGDKKKIAAATEVYNAALKAEKAAGIDDRDIDRAAGEVLAARGEAHTETGILPPHHNIRSVKANREFAEKRRQLINQEDGVTQADVNRAAENLADAEEADRLYKLEHMARSQEISIAEHQGA